MSIINREKAIEEVKGALEREEIWIYDFINNIHQNRLAYHYHDGKANAYQNVLDMLTNNVRIKEG